MSAKRRIHEEFYANEPPAIPSKKNRVDGNRLSNGSSTPARPMTPGRPSTSTLSSLPKYQRIEQPPVSFGSDTYKYKDGNICEIYLENFMTHQEFGPWKPNPRVNLITGANGSGKSSILQAIVIGLGGNAADTKRASNQKSFIRQDQNKAIIRIHLYNGGELPFNPAAWGKEIIFEKRILQSGANHFTITGASGKKARDPQAYKDLILQHFQIELNNPITLLQQEEAKNFFKMNDDKKLYQFFQRGSMLDSIEQTNKKTMYEIQLMAENIKEDQKKSDALKRDMTRLDEVKTEMNNAVHHAGQGHPKTLWSKFYLKDRKLCIDALDKKRTVERQFHATQQSLNQLNQRINKINQEMEGSNIDKARLEDEMEKLQSEQSIVDGILKEKEEELRVVTERLEVIKRDKLNNQQTTRELEMEKRSQRIDINKNNASRAEVEQSQEDRKKILELEEKNLTEEDDKNAADIGEEGKKRDLKAEEIEMVEREMRDYDKTIKLSDQAHRSKMNQIRSDLSQKSELARYSTAIDRLCQDIEANVHQFRSKPIGPLGRHIKLTQEAARNDKLNSLLEIQLGQKNLKSFLVECKEDQRVLDNLMRKHWHLKAKQPMITTRKSYGRRYDITKGQIPSSAGVKTIIDYLIFQHDEVFNYFIDKAQIQQVIVTDDESAQRLFHSLQSVPQNTKSAITPTFYTYNPPTRGGNNYSSYYIRKPDYVVNLLIPEQDLQRQINAQEQEHRSEIAKLRQEKEVKFRETGVLISEKRQFEERIKVLQGERSQIKQKRQHLMVKRKELENSQRTISDIEKHLETSKLKLKELVAEGNQKMDEKANLKKEIDGPGGLRERAAPIQNKLQKKFKHIMELESKMKEPTMQKQAAVDTRKKRETELKQHTESLKQQEAECESYQKIMNEAEREALKASNGKVWKQEECFQNIAEAKAQKKELDKRSEQLKGEYGNKDRVQAELRELTEKYNTLELLIVKQNHEIENLEEEMGKRRSKHKNVMDYTKREVIRSFGIISDLHGMPGNLRIVHNAKVMKVNVCPSKESNPARERVCLTSLSGGEKSKTLFFLIHSLWQHLSCPFRGLDEWDVFMDDKARMAVEKILVDSSTKLDSQFFFISPQNSIFDDPQMKKKYGNLVETLKLKKNQ